MKKELLIIFIKNPILGKVKTRLAATVGKNKALQVYLTLLQHTFEITKELPLEKAVFYADFIEDNDIWKTGNFLKFIQEGNDLGEKMENSFINAFSLGYKKICIIGSDCYELTQVHLLKAFENLDKNPIVLGPSYDGGYYLLGMNRMVNELFYNKIWSSPSVFQDTINNLNQLSLEYSLIEKLNDVDEEKDLTDDLSY